jgi:glycosyltransferase involved in cell wall biosynthesis
MKILLASHAAWRGTGYGAPVIPLIKEWRKQGHDAAVFAVEERGPGVMEYRGIQHYLPANLPYGEDVIQACADDFKADVIVSFFDAWVLRGSYAHPKRRWIAWTPVDQTPTVPGLVEKLGKAERVLSFSEWGANVLNAEAPELKASAMPIGIDLEMYTPLPENQRAAVIELPEGAFVVGLVGTNLPHDRKALAEQIAAFCAFAAIRPNAYLLLWTTPTGGLDLQHYLQQFGAEGKRVLVQAQWNVLYDSPNARKQDLRELYGRADVLLHASAAEGFGLSILEAMACGTPVIGAFNTSMPELIPQRCGWLATIMTGQLSPRGGWWNRPTVDGLLGTLERACSDIKSIGLKRPYAESCVGWAKAFAWDLIGERWEEVFKDL